MDLAGEYQLVHEGAGLIDVSQRGKIELVGPDAASFLHNLATNDIRSLAPGSGCETFLTNAKGKMQSDLYLYCLPDELLLDFEPGLSTAIIQRLDKYIIADDVQVIDIAPQYGLLSIQGPTAPGILAGAGFAMLGGYLRLARRR